MGGLPKCLQLLRALLRRACALQVEGVQHGALQPALHECTAAFQDGAPPALSAAGSAYGGLFLQKAERQRRRGREVLPKQSMFTYEQYEVRGPISSVAIFLTNSC